MDFFNKQLPLESPSHGPYRWSKSPAIIPTISINTNPPTIQAQQGNLDFGPGFWIVETGEIIVIVKPTLLKDQKVTKCLDYLKARNRNSPKTFC